MGTFTARKDRRYPIRGEFAFYLSHRVTATKQHDLNVAYHQGALVFNVHLRPLELEMVNIFAHCFISPRINKYTIHCG